MTPSSQESPGWIEISIRIHAVAQESLSAFLFELGCEGLISEGENNRTLKAYLPFQQDLKSVEERILRFLQDLEQIFPEVRSPDVGLSKMENRDWSEGWRRFFRPDRVTRRLVIMPAWESGPTPHEAAVILMDPGPAFGTGQHATTRMCLEAMENASLPEPWTMLDVGTGSGILSIYGAKLGAGRIIALDTDPEALRWAERNISLNNLTGRIELSSTPVEALKGQFSLLVANLTLGPILDLMPLFPGLVAPAGRLILSGILTDQVTKAQGGLEKHGFSVGQSCHQAEWACLIATRGPLGVDR
jgi:ribosomal protein L11 methyltransferase